MAESTTEFSQMKPITTPRKLLKLAGREKGEKVKFLLSKAWNLIHEVDFDPESHQGRVIVNVSYLKEEDFQEGLNIFGHVITSVQNTLQ